MKVNYVLQPIFTSFYVFVLVYNIKYDLKLKVTFDFFLNVRSNYNRDFRSYGQHLSLFFST